MAGLEPASGRLTAACPYQHGSHRNQVRTAGVEPAISWSRTTRNTRLSYVLFQERPAGVEPALPPWQGSRLPLHHGRVLIGWIVKDREHRAGLEPTLPHYGCGVLAAGRPVLFVTVGPEGLEPSPGGLRVRCAAASTLIPCRFYQSARKESNLRPDPYKRPALTVELRAAFSRAGGTRTLAWRIKSPLWCRYTTTPYLVGRMRFNRANIASLLFLGSCQW